MKTEMEFKVIDLGPRDSVVKRMISKDEIADRDIAAWKEAHRARAEKYRQVLRQRGRL